LVCSTTICTSVFIWISNGSLMMAPDADNAQ
jgi:hypothetical protein